MTPGRAVVVDDDADMLLLVSMRLERLGWTVRTAASVEDAVALFDAEPPDLAVIDLRMPGMGGRGLLRHVRSTAALAGVPVIVVSADASKDVADEALALGAQCYLSKPFGVDDLQRAIEALPS